MDLVGIVVGQDVTTAACGLLNAGYFGARLWQAEGRARRIGALALTLGSLAAVVEAGLSQALFWSGRGALALGQDSPEVWALTRLPLFAATLLVSAIIVRKLGG